MTSQPLYTIPSLTSTSLRSFRLSSSRSPTPLAQIYSIDKSTLQILRDSSTSSTTLDSLQLIADALPDHTPRFILLSYPYTTDDGRTAAPYLLLFYMPPTANGEMRMLYAGAKELVRKEAEAGRVLEVDGEEEVLEIEEKIRG